MLHDIFKRLAQRALLPVVILGTGLMVQGAVAQSSIPNPLRPSPSSAKIDAAPAPIQTAVQATGEKPKPKRERSAKQKQSDDDMRACGASWKADKPALTAKGETWRSYLKTCRSARKAARS